MRYGCQLCLRHSWWIVNTCFFANFVRCQLWLLSTLFAVNFVCSQLCSSSTLLVVKFVCCQLCPLSTLFIVNFVRRQLCSLSTLFAAQLMDCQHMFLRQPESKPGSCFPFLASNQTNNYQWGQTRWWGEEHPQCQSDYCWSLLITLLSRYIPLILWLESSAEPKCLSTLLFQGHFSHLWWSAFSRKPPDSRIFSVTYFELDTWPGVTQDN